jgi:hypothetical protein
MTVEPAAAPIMEKSVRRFMVVMRRDPRLSQSAISCNSRKIDMRSIGESTHGASCAETGRTTLVRAAKKSAPSKRRDRKVVHLAGYYDSIRDARTSAGLSLCQRPYFMALVTFVGRITRTGLSNDCSCL